MICSYFCLFSGGNARLCSGKILLTIICHHQVIWTRSMSGLRPSSVLHGWVGTWTQAPPDGGETVEAVNTLKRKNRPYWHGSPPIETTGVVIVTISINEQNTSWFGALKWNLKWKSRRSGGLALYPQMKKCLKGVYCHPTIKGLVLSRRETEDAITSLGPCLAITCLSTWCTGCLYSHLKAVTCFLAASESPCIHSIFIMFTWHLSTFLV